MLQKALEKKRLLQETRVLRERLEDKSALAQSSASDIAIPGSTLAEIERQAILRTLESLGGSTLRAADALQISARKIQYKVKEYRRQGVVVPRRS